MPEQEPGMAAAEAAQETAAAAKTKADEIARGEGTGMMDGNFSSKALVILLGIVMSALMAFFVWLATAIIDVRERTVRIELNVESLMETRTSQAVESTARTARRVEQLEQDAEEAGKGK